MRVMGIPLYNKLQPSYLPPKYLDDLPEFEPRVTLDSTASDKV